LNIVTDKPNHFREFQKSARKAQEAASGLADKAIQGGKQKLAEIDDQYHLSDKTRQLGESIGNTAKSVDKHTGISRHSRDARDALIDSFDALTTQGKHIAEQTGIVEAARSATSALKQIVIQPGAEYLETSGINERLYQTGATLASAYGQTRAVIKPYFAPESARELLQNTRYELARITATLMQTNTDETDRLARQFSSAFTAKASGVVAAGLTLATVGTLGTASTGTAIATLSGAAANSASLYWLGSVVGGGVAAGAIMTGGVSLVAGLAAYKFLNSESRSFETLSVVEQDLVQGCWLLIARIDELLKLEPVMLGDAAAQTDLDRILLPLYQMLDENADAICEHLDSRHRLVLRQHVLVDFERVVIRGYRYWANNATAAAPADIEYIIGGAFYALLTRTALDDSPQSQLVLQALRRSAQELIDATEGEISDYLDRYSDAQLKGIANNVKGIYHELLYVQQYNASHSSTYAELFEQTNHPGADVIIRNASTHHVLEQYQLKAAQATGTVEAHLQRYADIRVLATEEVAQRMDGIESSGISNAVITQHTNHDLDALADNTVEDRVLTSLGLATCMAGGQEFVALLRGLKPFPDAVTSGLSKVGIASAATLLTAYLFG